MAEWVEKGSLKGPPGEIPDVSDFLRDSDVSPSISGSSDKVASDKAVKDYVDNQVSAEATARQELKEEVDRKADAEHTHEISDVTDLQTSLDGKASIEHSHDMEDVTGLDVALSGKSDTGHKHASTDITDFEEKMAKKADASHSHDVEDVAGLQTVLNGKAASVHTHTIENVTGLQGELDGKANSSHTHVSADITDLQEKLNAKADTIHEHSIGNVTGLQTALDAKADDEHTHTSKDITDFNDAVSVQIPMTLPNDFALNMNIGEESVTYDGSSYQTVDITAEAIGAASDDHKHSASDITSGTFNIARIPTITDAKIDSVSATKLTGTIPQDNLPSYVDDVVEYAGMSSFPEDGEAGKIYVDTTTNKTYRWSGSGYVEISASLALGTTSSTAFRGDYGNTAYQHATAKGSAFSSGLYKITTNSQGHVTAATAVTKGDITALGIPAQDTKYSNATSSTDGLMSSEDKTKLDGVDMSGVVKQDDGYLTDNNGNPLESIGLTDGAGTIVAVGYNDEMATFSTVKGNSTVQFTAQDNASALGTTINDEDTTISSAIGTTNEGANIVTTFGDAQATVSALPNGATIQVTDGNNGIALETVNGNSHIAVKKGGSTTSYAVSDTISSSTNTIATGKGVVNYVANNSPKYTLSKDGSTIKLVGTDGTSSSVTDSNTTYTLSSFGITATAAELNKLDGVTATATELNYVDGVTSNIQTQLNGKAASSHTHNYAGSGSAGGSANSAVKLDSSAGSATQPVYFSGGKPVATTYTLSASVPSGAKFTDTTYSVMKGATSSAAGGTGLVPAPAAGKQTSFLRGDGTWVVPTNTTYSNMTGATTSAAGKAGLVPAPSAGAATRYLRSDGTWQVPPDTNTTYTLSSFGITATAAELNKLDGVTATATHFNYLNTLTGNVQTQLNGKAASSHTHNYAGSSSAGGAATSANLVNSTTLTNQNLNNYHSGVAFYNAGGGNTCTNKPSGVDNFGMFVFQTAGGWYTQVLYGSDDAMYTRRWVSDTWTAWSKMYSSTKKPTASEIGAAASSHTHPVSQVTGLTASRALISDSSGHPAVSAVTSTELSYLDGVTSAIQTQLNGKAALSHSHSAATTSAAGFMSAADKTKLNGLSVASDADFKAYMGIS